MSTCAEFPVVIAVDDPTRSTGRAVALARHLASASTAGLDLVTLESDGDRVAGLIDRLASRDGIVIIEAHGGGCRGDVLFDEEAEAVLQHATMPVVVIGPNAVAHCVDSVVVVADATTVLRRPLAVATRWAATFPLDLVAVEILEPPTSWPDPAPVDSDPARAELAAVGLDATLRYVATQDPPGAIKGLATEFRDPLLVLTASRWTHTDHWFSTVRDVIRHATCPVLVVAG